MYRIAVCEDEPNLRTGLCGQCRDILTELDVEHEIVSFPSAEELEQSLMDGVRFDLLCLDIFLGKKSGMDLALEVRKWDERVSILFITSSAEYVLEGYKANAIRYLLKPVKREELKEALQTDLHRNHQPRTVVITAGGKTAVVPWTEIWYVESQNHGCLFHIAHGVMAFPLTMAQAEAVLPEGQFCRCHNSFLVNLAQIRAFTSREIQLLDGVRLPIGRRYAEDFQSAFVRYINDH